MLIPGSNSVTSQGLTAAFHALGSTVIITGCRRTTMDLDVIDADEVQRVTARLIQEFTALNAGMMSEENLTTGEVEVAEAHIATNLPDPIRLRYVRTGLQGERQANGPNTMLPGGFSAQTVEMLKDDQDVT